MNPAMQLQVHPAISWQHFDDTRIQIRVPDGQHITLTECAREAGLILNRLSQPNSYEQTLSWAGSENIDREILDSTLSTLHEYSIIVETPAQSPLQNDGMYKNALEFNVNSSKALRSGLAYPYFNKINVIGRGQVKSCIEQIAAQALQGNDALRRSTAAITGNGDSSEAAEVRPLRVVCSDDGDQQFIQDVNRQAVEDGVALLVVQWTEEYLSVGPLYIPGESACFECFTVRKRAASNFLAELDGAISRPPQRAAQPNLDPFIDNLIKYAVGRYLATVVRGLFHLIKPNEVEMWDVVKAERTVGEALRVPRCDVCGRKKSSDPVRAVRDLNN